MKPMQKPALYVFCTSSQEIWDPPVRGPVKKTRRIQCPTSLRVWGIGVAADSVVLSAGRQGGPDAEARVALVSMRKGRKGQGNEKAEMRLTCRRSSSYRRLCRRSGQSGSSRASRTEEKREEKAQRGYVLRERKG